VLLVPVSTTLGGGGWIAAGEIGERDRSCSGDESPVEIGETSMAKVCVIDDFEEYAQMTAAPLQQAGHEVMTQVSEKEGEVDFERVISFGPNVVTVGLYRNQIAFNRPIKDISEDVLGYVPLTEMEKYPAINAIPILLIGNALEEQDIPTTVGYDAFLVFPRDIKILLKTVEELAHAKVRRRISGYVCPTCGGRLTFSASGREQDLFCPRDHTVIAIIDEESCIAKDEWGGIIPCSVAKLLPPKRTTQQD
jgi:uncharacterized protein YbaR (Trm112 family)